MFRIIILPIYRSTRLCYSLWYNAPTTLPAVEPGSTPRPLVQNKTWRDSLPIDMLLSTVSVLVVAQSSSEIPEGLMNNPVYKKRSLESSETPVLYRGSAVPKG